TRAGEEKTVSVKLGSLPTTIPEGVPPSRERNPNADAAAVADWIEIKVPEQPNECLAFVPLSYQADVPHGVVVYLRPPGAFDKSELLTRWRPFCEANDLILLAPQPLDTDRWTPVEVEFLQKTVEQIIANYSIDKSRVVLYGQDAGGALAYLFAFRNREIARAVVAVDAAMPVRLRPPDTDPVYPLAILTTQAVESRVAERVEQAIGLLRGMKYPVTVLPMEAARALNDQELDKVIRWIDALDRV
ncbi:MAG: hypothetical protein ABI614_17700, partial [Planctomycetota bacterium]